MLLINCINIKYHGRSDCHGHRNRRANPGLPGKEAKEGQGKELALHNGRRQEDIHHGKGRQGIRKTEGDEGATARGTSEAEQRGGHHLSAQFSLAECKDQIPRTVQATGLGYLSLPVDKPGSDRELCGTNKSKSASDGVIFTDVNILMPGFEFLASEN